jgi:L-ornithine Nalpha-acyltransferase
MTPSIDTFPCGTWRVRDPFRFARALVPAVRADGGDLGTDAGGDELAPGAPSSLRRLGALEVRLARDAAEIRRAQKLRFDVFYREKSAVTQASCLARRDVDRFDAACDHLLVLDHAAATAGAGGGDGQLPKVVATCRMLRQEVAERTGGFYSAGEFDIGSLLARRRDLRFLELGRSCVLPTYRTKRTVELLWHGIWAYVREHRSDVMIGCASLDGTDPDRLALPLAFLHHYARAPAPWRASALPWRYVELNRMPRVAVDPKAALGLLPPLIKGYVRLGAGVGDGAVIDRQFATTDVLIILPVSAIKSRYVDHFGPRAERHAA